MAGLVAVLAVGLRLYRFELPSTDGLTALYNGSLPPGLHIDEAFNGIAAWHAVRAHDFSPFVRIDLGRLPLHIYLTSVIFTLAGEPLVIGPRLAALLAGLLGVPVAGACAAAIFAQTQRPAQRRVVAALAAGMMAGSYWPVHFSRIGMEHTTHVLFASAAVGLLAWALQRPAPGRAALAGAAIGVAVYTYPVAYLLPLVGAAAVCFAGWQQNWPRRQWRRFGLVFSGAALVVLLPLAAFAVREPHWLLARPEGLAARSLLDIGSNVLRTVLGLVWRGDTNVSYNVPGRPLLDPMQSILFILGLSQCLRRLREPGCTMLLAWLLVMLLPQVLSQAPHFGRAVGAVPPLLIIAALGATSLWQAVERQSKSAWPGFALVNVLLLASAGLTARDYFVRWPQTSDLAATFRVAERIEAEAAQSTPADWARFISPVDHELSTIAFITGDAAPPRSYNGRVCTVVAAAGQPARYFITAYDEAATGERLAWVFGQELPEQAYPAKGPTLVRVIDTPAARPARPPGLAIAQPGWQVGNLLAPLSVSVSELPGHPASTINVRLLWQALASSPVEYSLGMYLLGPDYPEAGFGLASQADSGPCDGSYPTTDWHIGDWIIEDRQLMLPAQVAPGSYTLALAVYNWQELQRLPVIDARGTAVGDLLPLAQVEIVTP